VKIVFPTHALSINTRPKWLVANNGRMKTYITATTSAPIKPLVSTGASAQLSVRGVARNFLL